MIHSGGIRMKARISLAALFVSLLALPLSASAQGVVRGAQEGAAVGNRAAGPIGGAVGGAVGGVAGGVAGGVKGVLGIPQDTRVRRNSPRKAKRTRQAGR
jgi:hypothetical protein